jgi:hypothetical protein
MYPHRIRLRGPWTCQPLYRLVATTDGCWKRSTENLPPPFRCRMPARWSDACLPDFRGGVRFVRPFGYPGRIDEHERVWLTVAGLDGQATVTLNDQPLGVIDGKEGPAEFDITTVLRARNILGVEMESPEPCGGQLGEVALEVRATAFLRDVRYEQLSNQLTARGVVVGEAPGLLELYLFAADRFLTYDRVKAAPSGQSFTLSGDLSGQAWPAPLPVRVELIDTAGIWYVVEGMVSGAQSNPIRDSLS